jgi:hypothetical protein
MVSGSKWMMTAYARHDHKDGQRGMHGCSSMTTCPGGGALEVWCCRALEGRKECAMHHLRRQVFRGEECLVAQKSCWPPTPDIIIRTGSEERMITHLWRHVPAEVQGRCGVVVLPWGRKECAMCHLGRQFQFVLYLVQTNYLKQLNTIKVIQIEFN